MKDAGSAQKHVLGELQGILGTDRLGEVETGKDVKELFLS